jgi:hypothetical protein
MSAMKAILDDLTTFELLDWYADELHGNWAPAHEVAEAFDIRNWFQADIEKRYNITTEGFIEMLKMHSEYVNTMHDDDLHEYEADWALQAQAMHNYYRQAFRASVVAA